MKIFLQKNQTITASVVALMLIAALISCLPAVNAQKTNITLAATLYPIIGENSDTFITWMPTPNPFLSAPYVVPNMVDTPMWPDAKVTFTRPDGSTDVVNGPFTVYFLKYASGAVGFNPELQLVYKPNMQGNWTMTFTWPGDSMYNAVTTTNTFTVGPHFPKRDSWALLSIRPYPAIGIGQELLVNAFVTPPPMTAYENFKGFHFTIQRPDFSVYLDFKMDSEAPGVSWFSIYPDKLGNWSITMDWPGNYFYNPCSITRYINVQDNPIPYPVQDTPLPTEYWSAPVNIYNREWRNIAGPWFQQYYNASKGSCNQYTEAPKTSHIIWKLPPASGAGGYIGSTDKYQGIETSGIYTSTAARMTAVMAGRGYYSANSMVYCVDIRTGKQLWSTPGSFNVGATRSRAPVLYSFGNQFVIYDALTGAVTLNTTGLSMLMYDDPRVISMVGSNMICWSTEGTSTNFTTRILWNITDPYLAFPWATSNWNYLIADGLVVYQLQRYGRVTYEDAVMEYMIARNETTGALVYAKQIIDPAKPDTWLLQQGPARSAGYGLYYYSVTGDPSQIHTTNPNALTTGGYVAFRIKTGDLAWFSEPYPTYPWGCFHCYNPEACGYGMIYDLSYAGIFALNATSGKIVWQYSAGNSGMETPYNTWPFGSVGAVIGGGVIFAPETEHSPTLYYRGNTLKAVDAYTGKEIWDIMGYYSPSACAYGTLFATETPSGYSYAFSKGPTATTVDVTKLQVAKGETVGITGTIMDQSPAQPNTPCVSKESMTQWMEYVHMQQSKPTNTTGVSVKLTAIKSDGTNVDIATVTSNAYGTFTYQWNPADQGAYTIVASFLGDDSYYSSSATTEVNVGPATATPSASPTSTPSTSPTASPTVAPTPPGTTQSTDLYIIIAAVIIIIIVVAVAALLLRRRK